MMNIKKVISGSLLLSLVALGAINATEVEHRHHHKHRSLQRQGHGHHLHQHHRGSHHSSGKNNQNHWGKVHEYQHTNEEDVDKSAEL